MRIITEVENLKGKFVLLRSSLNVPLKDSKLKNHFRLHQALPTMRYLHEHGAKTILVAHIGRNPEETLKPVYDELAKYLPIHWGGNIAGEEFAKRRELMSDGDILMAENLRRHPGEKENASEFIELLAKQAELYVNDAFAVVHRKHASVFGVAKVLPAYAGLTLAEEVEKLSQVMQPKHPSLFMLGGAKFATKLPLIKKYLDIYDKVFVGGALANDIFKLRGYEVGRSLVSDEPLKDESFLHSEKLLVPIDVVVDGPNGRGVKCPDAVTEDETILDCGPLTIDMLVTYIDPAATILWNGPFGAYEQGYTQGTELTARHIAGAPGFSVVGGGDTVAAIEKLEINDLFGFLSTGGGSMLAFLEHGTTPALELLK